VSLNTAVYNNNLIWKIASAEQWIGLHTDQEYKGDSKLLWLIARFNSRCLEFDHSYVPVIPSLYTASDGWH